MATESDHRKKAEHNLRFLRTIDVDKFPDWAATVIFYTAVHLVEMMFRKRGGQGGNHRIRNDTLRKIYGNVWKHYHPLYNHSRLARYRCLKVKAKDIPELQQRLDLLTKAIEKHMNR